MLGLAVETSSNRGSVCLARLGKTLEIIAEESWEKSGSHSERSTLATLGLLQKERVSLAEIDCFAAGVGPGSFTGIRVAVNLIRSWGYSLQRPCYAVNSLRLMAEGFLPSHPGERVLCIVNAFKNLFYVAGFESDENLLVNAWLQPRTATADQIRELHVQNSTLAYDSEGTQTLVESSFVMANQPLSTGVVSPASASAIWRVVNRDNLTSSVWNLVVPLYIRASEAEEKLLAGELKLPPRL